MLKSGEMLSHYRIVSAIGSGGMGEVYLAEDTKLDRKIALKVLLHEVSDDTDRINRFVLEAKAASALNHPNILTVYEIGSANGSQYISTEFIKGETLRDRMKREPIQLRDALKIVMQITAALGAAHEAGIIHRDIKPENVMIRSDGLVKVLDFGLAKLSPLSAASIETTIPHINTKPGVIVGTVAYMSPEQARGRKIDPRSDIFSLGIVMFELFTGNRPFDGESQLELISSILKDEAPKLRYVSPDLPRELERILEKSLRKDVDHRYQHIRDLHIDIEDLEEELKFESKMHKSVHPTIDATIHVTNQSHIRSAFTTGISTTRRFTLLHALVFIAVIAGLVVATWYLRPVSAPVAATYKAREVASWTSAPGELFGTASFSPDGKMIAFASTRSGTKAIWVTQTNSTEAIQVTNDQFANTEPIWSVTGDEIAYLSRRPGPDGSTTTSMWRVSALGGTPRSIAPVGDGTAMLRRWANSGKIYYEIGGNLYAIDIATGSSQKITSLEVAKPRWITISPDEGSIIFATESDNEWHFFTADISGSNQTQISRGTGRLNPGFALSADQKRIYFTVNSEFVTNIMLVTADLGRVEKIATPESDSIVLDGSPDGRSLLLGSSKEDLNLWRVSTLDGRESPVVRDIEAELWPAVSPDGQKVAYQSIRGLSAGNKLLSGSILVKSLKSSGDGDRGALIAQNGFLPKYSPDGALIAFLKLIDNSWQLFAADASGGSERSLASYGKRMDGFSVSPYNLTQSNAFAWSPKDNRIVYSAERNGVTNLYFVSSQGGVETPLTFNTDSTIFFSCPVWSRDGRRIAFSYQRAGRDQNGKRIRGIRWIDVATGISSQVIETPRTIRLLGWTDNGDGLVAAEADKEDSGLPERTNLLRFPITGEAEITIAALKNIYFYNIFLADDGKQIAYAAREQNLDDLWIISSNGGVPRKITNNNDSGQFYSRLDWSRDGSSIVFGKQTRFSLLSLLSEMD